MTRKSGLNADHIHEFSRRAKSYTRHNVIQKKVVEKLFSKIDSNPGKILDLGCGSGAVYDRIDWEIERFVGIDKADQMCMLHPKNEKITLLHADFEDEKLLNRLGTFDMVISSSALQWARNLEKLFDTIAQITDQIAFAIFCDGTFKTIYEMTGMQTFLPNVQRLLPTLEKRFDITYEVKDYRLEFPDNLSKFRYIKQSGVSGGKKVLGVRQTRELIRKYPLTYLEFEVLFCYGRVKK